MTNNLNITAEGLLDPVIYCASPYCDERPQANNIDLIVIHGISLPPGQFGNQAIEAFFCGKLDFSQHAYYPSIAHLKVSAHLLIKRDGTIIQFVPFLKRAWHAGESSFQGKKSCNDFSIGIELEGTDEIPYEQNQYQKLLTIIPLLKKHYPAISRERIVGHQDIAPNRKRDPGPFFDWTSLQGIIP